jgi:hypothetical protein
VGGKGKMASNNKNARKVAILPFFEVVVPAM